MSIHDNSRRSKREEDDSGRTTMFRKAVFNLLLSTEEALTSRQIMNRLKEDDVNNIRPEVTRLKEDGLIRETGTAICDVTRKTVAVFRPTGLPYMTRTEAKEYWARRNDPPEQGTLF